MPHIILTTVIETIMAIASGSEDTAQFAQQATLVADRLTAGVPDSFSGTRMLVSFAPHGFNHFTTHPPPRTV